MNFMNNYYLLIQRHPRHSGQKDYQDGVDAGKERKQGVFVR